MERTLFDGSHQLLARALQPPVRHDTAPKRRTKRPGCHPIWAGSKAGAVMLISCGSRTPAKNTPGKDNSDYAIPGFLHVTIFQGMIRLVATRLRRLDAAGHGAGLISTRGQAAAPLRNCARRHRRAREAVTRCRSRQRADTLVAKLDCPPSLTSRIIRAPGERAHGGSHRGSKGETLICPFVQNNFCRPKNVRNTTHGARWQAMDGPSFPRRAQRTRCSTLWAAGRPERTHTCPRVHPCPE
eukprot:gene13202-biopygen14076